MVLSSPLPVVPPEIWIKILQSYGNNLKDMAHLWTQCRQVSKQFNAEIENIFVKQYLPIIGIDFRLLATPKEQPRTRDVLTADGGYVGLSKDNKRALFRVPAANMQHENEEYEKITPWGDWTLRVHKVGEDTARTYVHGVTYFEEGDVVGIGWKELLDGLFLQKH